MHFVCDHGIGPVENIDPRALPCPRVDVFQEASPRSNTTTVGDADEGRDEVGGEERGVVMTNRRDRTRDRPNADGRFGNTLLRSANTASEYTIDVSLVRDA